MEITIEDIKKFAKPHPSGRGKQTRIATNKFIFSVVGGASGLYGDFEEDFELAILRKSDKEFCTQLIVPEATDDVIGYLSGDQVVEIIQPHISNGFQVE